MLLGCEYQRLCQLPTAQESSHNGSHATRLQHDDAALHANDSSGMNDRLA